MIVFQIFIPPSFTAFHFPQAKLLALLSQGERAAMRFYPRGLSLWGKTFTFDFFCPVFVRRICELKQATSLARATFSSSIKWNESQSCCNVKF